MIKLYHYVHCPFCVRVRMALGFLNLEFDSIVLDYDDEKTPVDLMGKKMLPIASSDDWISNESLEIIKNFDKENKLKIRELDYLSIEPLLNKLGKDIHNLAMPYWMWTPEFNEISRDYFEKKKSVKRGPFNKLVQRQSEFIGNLHQTLLELECSLSPFFKSTEFTIDDILLASHLWGLYIVPEFQFSTKMHEYLQEIKRITSFNYHQDFWKS